MADETRALEVKAEAETLSLTFLSVGKKKKRALKDLKRGRGRLMDEVEQTLEEVRDGLGSSASSKEIVPVIIIFRQKQKRKRREFAGWF
jgi:hypothetical protein